MTSWRDRKYAGQGNRQPRSVPPEPRHADDGHCHCAALQRALATGQPATITTWTGPDGTAHPIPDEATAKKVKNRAYHCGGHCGVSLVMGEPGLGLVQLGEGRWGFRFRPIDPATAKAHIEGKRARGEQLAYEHVKGERRARPPRKGKKQTEAESIAAHRPLVVAVRHAIDPDQVTDPGPVPPIPPAPPGYDAITGRRLRPREGAPTASGQMLGTEGQTLMALLQLRREQLAQQRAQATSTPTAPPQQDTGRNTISGLIDRWKTGNW